MLATGNGATAIHTGEMQSPFSISEDVLLQKMYKMTLLFKADDVPTGPKVILNT